MAHLHDFKTKQATNHFVHDSGEELSISAPVLERVCKNIIEIILSCLPQAVRGTVYKVGPIPELRVVRVASGHRHGESDEIRWEMKGGSRYEFPGKVWEDYRDRPGGILEAMAWCIERQKSWTADDPEHNVRSLRKQLEGNAGDDYHHMEPVLVQESELWDELPLLSAYPKDNLGKPIWQNSSYASVAVIKIHFMPGTIRRGGSPTRVIKTLSQSLGTQMLSLHAREVALENERKLVKERKETCNTLAHEFRNLLPRIGFAYRALNNEIAYLRDSWENLLYDKLPALTNKRIILQKLNEVLKDVETEYGCTDLLSDISRLSSHQKELMASCLLPQQNEAWLRQRIAPLWLSILSRIPSTFMEKSRVEELLERLKKSFYVVADKRFRDKVETIPELLKAKWVDLAYREMNGRTNGQIKQYIELLENLDFDLARKRYALKNFMYLKEIVELIPELERKLNHRLELLKSSGLLTRSNAQQSTTTKFASDSPIGTQAGPV